MKQSRLDGFLKPAAPSRTSRANRSAMLQEFFMGTLAPAKKKKQPNGNTSITNQPGNTETSFSSVENNGLLESRVVMGE